MRVARWFLVAYLLLLTVPWVAMAGVNVFLGSATIPSAATDANLLAIPADSTGDVPGPTVFASSTVLAFPADGLGAIRAPSVSGTGFTCNTTISAGSLSSAMSSATAGSTVCLNAGSYTYTASTITKASMVTARPANGVAQSAVTVAYVDVQASNNLRFQDMTVDGGALGGSSTTATNVQFSGVAFTGGLCLNVPGTTTGRGILVDSSTFINVGDQACGNEGRLTINGRNTSHASAWDQGIVVSNNTFSGGSSAGACADGIQLTGDASGATISGNSFTGIKQGSCSPAHVDPIQFYGAGYTTITGNYFGLGNSTGIMAGDCNQSPMRVTNNVFHYDGEYQDQIVAGGSVGDLFEHNVMADGSTIRMGQVNPCGQSSGNTIRNNVLTGGMRFTTCNGASECNGTQANSCSGCTFANNLVPSGGGSITQTGGFTGNPTYVGGATPSSWAGFVLASTSLGYLGATDGFSVGVN